MRCALGFSYVAGGDPFACDARHCFEQFSVRRVQLSVILTLVVTYTLGVPLSGPASFLVPVVPVRMSDLLNRTGKKHRSADESGTRVRAGMSCLKTKSSTIEPFPQFRKCTASNRVRYRYRLPHGLLRDVVSVSSTGVLHFHAFQEFQKISWQNAHMLPMSVTWAMLRFPIGWLNA